MAPEFGRYDLTGLRMGPSAVFSIVKVTSLVLEGLQSGSSELYRTYSAVSWSLYQSVTLVLAPSVREFIGWGEIVPANLPPMKANELYPSGRHIPSKPASPEITVTPQPRW
jgi:hypothetical protein